MNLSTSCSKFSYHEMICPQCGYVEEMQLWDSIDGAEDRWLKELIFEKTLHVFRCPNCDFSAWVERELLYYDISSRFMIFYLPDYEGDVLELDLSEFVSQVGERKLTLRIVNDLEEFIEKIRIFEDGLDDRAVELLKKSFADNWNKRYPNRSVVLRYTQKTIPDHRIKIHVFEPETQDVIALEFDYDTGYQKALELAKSVRLFSDVVGFLKVDKSTIGLSILG